MFTTPNGSRYIGQTRNYLERWHSHKDDAKRGKGCPGVRNAIKKWGWKNIKKEVLVWCRPEDMDHLERLFIDLYDTHKNGLNCTEGGDVKPMQDPSIVARVIATWDQKAAERLSGADYMTVRKVEADRNKNRERRRAHANGTFVDGRSMPSERRIETWKLKRQREADEWGIKRLAKEDERLKELPPDVAATKRHNSRKEKERKDAVKFGLDVPDGRFGPSAKRQATWAAKLEAKVAGMSPAEADKVRRKAAQRAKYKASLRKAKRTE